MSKPTDLGTAVAGQSLVDLINVGGDGLKAGVEAVVTLLLNLLKSLLGFLGSLPGRLKLCRDKQPINPSSCTSFPNTHTTSLDCLLELGPVLKQYLHASQPTDPHTHPLTHILTHTHPDTHPHFSTFDFCLRHTVCSPGKGVQTAGKTHTHTHTHTQADTCHSQTSHTHTYTHAACQVLNSSCPGDTHTNTHPCCVNWSWLKCQWFMSC